MKFLMGTLIAVFLSSSVLAAPFQGSEDSLEDQDQTEEVADSNRSEDAQSKDESSEEASCQSVSFKNAPWRAFANGNAYSYPRVNRADELILLPVTVYAGASAYLYTNPDNIKPPFEVMFEFNTLDDDGGMYRVWNSADGIRFFFLRNISRYGQPLAGGSMGRSAVAGGYAVSFPIYGARRARLDDYQGSTIKRVPFSKAYSHGEWIPVKVTVKEGGITVVADNLTLFEQKVNWALGKTGDAMGFSAATGAANSSHMIRNFCIRPLN
ncbi:hypothetical protein [Endozoicomonas sp. OPT23]|uniref:lectin-like domain-containing protein n=1 Tax=Endozoicomonas sp. OPT23 TaxID=2072845 RepID=UPI00129ACA5C|nr:hypothetical protein [Endozoicomonas sp. OPT23]